MWPGTQSTQQARPSWGQQSWSVGKTGDAHPVPCNIPSLFRNGEEPKKGGWRKDASFIIALPNVISKEQELKCF